MPDANPCPLCKHTQHVYNMHVHMPKKKKRVKELLKKCLRQASWSSPEISALGRLRQMNHKFKSSLG